MGDGAKGAIMTDKLRDAFEAWFAAPRKLETILDGSYRYMPADTAWRTWQAASKYTLEEAAEVCFLLFRPSAALSPTEQGAWEIGTLDCETAIKELLNE
jgi:hypothetical protein